METLFENIYIRDKKMAKEISSYIYFKRTLNIVITVACSICFLINLISMFAGLYYTVYGLVFLPVYLGLQFYFYLSYKNALVKRDAETHDGPVSVSVDVYDEHIEIATANGSNKLSYDKIKKVLYTENYTILLSKARLMYVLRNDGFIKGSKDGFIAFLNNKGVKM